MLSLQQKMTTLVKILFRAAHTYSKDSKKRCLVNWSKNRAALVNTLRPLAATSRVIFELKPIGKSIRGSNGSEPWVGRSTAETSGNPT